MRWLAIDPGKTIGWAVGWVAAEQRVHIETYDEMNATSDLRHLEAIEDLVNEYAITAAVIEKYVPRSRNVKVGGTIAIEVGQDIHSLLSSSLAIETYWQQASDAKGVITDDRLKRMGYWVKGKPHARDAIRHLVIATRKHEPRRRS